MSKCKLFIYIIRVYSVFVVVTCGVFYHWGNYFCLLEDLRRYFMTFIV